MTVPALPATATATVKTRAGWTACIRERWQASVEAILDVGRLLLDAKAALPRGEFETMVSAELPFGPRAARMLMAVAQHPALSDRNHGSVLPPSWRTLYELTKLPEPVLAQALEDGTITPETERRHVLRLRDAAARAAGESETPPMITTLAKRGTKTVPPREVDVNTTLRHPPSLEAWTHAVGVLVAKQFDPAEDGIAQRLETLLSILGNVDPALRKHISRALGEVRERVAAYEVQFLADLPGDEVAMPRPMVTRLGVEPAEAGPTGRPEMPEAGSRTARGA